MNIDSEVNETQEGSEFSRKRKRHESSGEEILGIEEPSDRAEIAETIDSVNVVKKKKKKKKSKRGCNSDSEENSSDDSDKEETIKQQSINTQKQVLASRKPQAEKFYTSMSVTERKYKHKK